MDDIHVGAIGILAGILTTSSFLPQICKIVKTRKVRDISLFMYLIFATGITLWLIYGIFLGEIPIILANIAGLVFCSYIIFAKVKFRDTGQK
jgi:MtN3 and saliva related transmembrane protein